MTQNATAYFNVVEQGRSNRARELEAHRANVVSEQHAANVLTETIRHNKALEAQQLQQLLESARHNAATEGLGYANLDLDWSRLGETARANRAAEAELFRAHRVQEVEAMRHNKSTELAGYASSAASILGAAGSLRSSKAAKQQAQVAKSRNIWQERESKQKVMQGWIGLINDTFRNISQTTTSLLRTAAPLLGGF